jgi:hypothetical protein
MPQVPSKPNIGSPNPFIESFTSAITFPNPWKEAKVITLPKPGKDLKFSENLRPISLLSKTGKLFEKVVLQLLQKYIQE